jgi:hypothetical protein
MKMKKAYSKLITLMALLLLATKGKAQASNSIDEEKINATLSEILQSTQGQPDLLTQIIALNKIQLEQSLLVTLTDNEFVKIKQLVVLLLEEEIDLQLVPVGKMVIATQEYGGGAR